MSCEPCSMEEAFSTQICPQGLNMRCCNPAAEGGTPSWLSHHRVVPGSSDLTCHGAGPVEWDFSCHGTVPVQEERGTLAATGLCQSAGRRGTLTATELCQFQEKRVPRGPRSYLRRLPD